MMTFIDTYKDIYGVDPICTVLSENIEGGFLTPSGYYRAKKRVPAARTLKDQLLIPELVKIHQENYGVYGVGKMWHAVRHAGWSIGRNQKARLMRAAETRL